MISLNDTMLHLLTRQTNLEKPYTSYITDEYFPDQITELLNTAITLKYRNHYVYSKEIYSVPATITFNGRTMSSRPSDDINFTERMIGPEDFEDDYILTDLFTVLRADAVEPHVLIAINADYSVLLISSTETDNNGEYKFNTLINEYPVQNNTLFGLATLDQFSEQLYGYSGEEYDGVVLRVDKTEPCNTVIAEFVDDGIRYVLGDECQSKVVGYYEINGSMIPKEFNYRTDINTLENIADLRKNIIAVNTVDDVDDELADDNTDEDDYDEDSLEYIEEN